MLPELRKLKNKLACEYEQKGDAPIYRAVAERFRNMPQVITTGVLANIVPEDPDVEKITWCPGFSAYRQEEPKMMLQSLNEGEKWWYGCNWPVSPDPTYHLDDELLPARIVSWMQFRYNITGNLYWRLNYWLRKNGDGFLPVEPYQNAYFNNCNGDGCLVYPGKDYGLDCFVPSIRMEAIRDGIEDYEAFYCMRELWNKNAEKAGVTPSDVNTVFEPYYTRMFNETTILSSPNITLHEAREALADALVASNTFAFAVTLFSEQIGLMRFIADGKGTCEGGRLTEQDGVYSLTFENEKATLFFEKDGKTGKASFFKNSVVHKKRYALAECWAETENRSGVQNASAENIVKPYFDVLQASDKKRRNVSAKHLDNLVKLVWKTETVIVKKQTEKGFEVRFTVPQGNFSCAEQYVKRDVKDATEYVVTTEKASFPFSIETEKGKFETVLYLI